MRWIMCRVDVTGNFQSFRSLNLLMKLLSLTSVFQPMQQIIDLGRIIPEAPNLWVDSKSWYKSQLTEIRNSFFFSGSIFRNADWLCTWSAKPHPEWIRNPNVIPAETGTPAFLAASLSEGTGSEGNDSIEEQVERYFWGLMTSLSCVCQTKHSSK